MCVCSSVGLLCEVPAVVFMKIFQLDIFGSISIVTQQSSLVEFVIFFCLSTSVEGRMPILFYASYAFYLKYEGWNFNSGDCLFTTDTN